MNEDSKEMPEPQVILSMEDLDLQVALERQVKKATKGGLVIPD